MARRCTLDVALLAALACVAGCDLTQGRVECRLGPEQAVAHAVAREFHAIELLRVGDAAIALWSEPAGLFARRIAADGKPGATAVRLGAACAGGIAALASQGRARVACLSLPSHDKEPRAGSAVVYTLRDDLAVDAATTLGSAGELSHGIALAAGKGGVEAVWHDGSADAQRVWWAALAASGARTRVISGEGRVAGGPTLVESSVGALAAWYEHWLQGDALESRVFAWRDGGGRPRELMRLRHLAPTLRFAKVGDDLVLGFREQPPDDRKPGLYVAPLSPLATALGTRVRIGRADGVSAPAIIGCVDGLVAAIPRTHGGDHFVGVHWLAPGLGQRRGGQQFYEDAHAFTQVAATCLENRALLLVAEHGMLHNTRTALHSVTYTCR